MDIFLTVIGHVRSRLIDLDQAPRQPDEAAPPATLDLLEPMVAAADGLAVGDAIVVLTWLDRARRDVLAVHPRGDAVVVLTWLDRARRDVLAVHPRGDAGRPLAGVFSTRSPDRPNPIGLHEVIITGLTGTRIEVSGLEAIHGTPILDIKPVLGPPTQR